MLQGDRAWQRPPDKTTGTFGSRAACAHTALCSAPGLWCSACGHWDGLVELSHAGKGVHSHPHLPRNQY